MIVTLNKLEFKAPRGFLVLDGVNGAGKSTLIDRIMGFLQARDLPLLSTREPGATALGRSLRPLLLESKAGVISPLAELLLFAADRADHVKQLIAPALAQKKLVISDRYYYSTTAFQGYGRGLNLETVEEINRIAIDGVRPDLALLLDLEPEEGLKRTRRRNTRGADPQKDNFEQEELDFHRRLRRGFLDLAEKCPEPCLVLDASRTRDEVWQEVEKALVLWIKACRN